MRLFGLVSILLLLLPGCRDERDVGNQTETRPVAAVTAVGAASAGGTFRARSGSDVVISGKDSDSDGAPILVFEWRQKAGPKVVLFEGTTASRTFTAPRVTVPTLLEFELTVIDAKGARDRETLRVQVEPIGDANRFLRDPSVRETLYLFVSPDDPGRAPSAIPYSLEVAPIVHWTDRSGTPRSQRLDLVLDVHDRIDAGFDAPADPVDPGQDHYRIDVPLLDTEEVNRFFQREARGGRLELEEIRNARVVLEVALSGFGPFEVYAAKAGFEQIPAEDIVVGRLIHPPSGAILDGRTDSVRLDLEAIRQQLGIESRRSASNYYACLGREDQTRTLDDWLEQAGFDGARDVVHARYVNNYDLGFGRDMFLRKDADGNVYSYVVNYPSLEQLLKRQNEFATVAMEYSAKPVGGCDAPVLDSDEKIVKFYAFVPDTTTGEMIRVESMNFDGRGERFLPGVCTSCHDGDLSKIAALDGEDLASIDADSADLGATFMPWDLDSLLFAEASDPALRDPFLNRGEFSRATLDAASREAQQSAFRALNEGALATYLDDVRRYEEPLRLIHGWYGNEASLPPADGSDELTDPSPLEAVPRSVLSDLPDVGFDGSYVPLGWRDGSSGNPDHRGLEERLYRGTYARYCRMCHTQQNDLSKNFDSYDEFVNASPTFSFAFQLGIMPLARLTLDRFWLPFDESSPAGVDVFADHLNRIGRPVAADDVPGRPVAIPSADPTLVEEVDAAGELLETVIDLDGTESLFADSFFWTVSDDSGCGVPSLIGANSPQASFVVDTSPCDYTVTLEIGSGFGTDEESVLVQTNRNPVSVAFTAPLDAGYTPGDSALDVDVLGAIPGHLDGDGALALVINDPDFGLVVNANASDLGGGSVRYALASRLGGTMESFQYQIVDLNGSIADAVGVVTVEVAAIVPQLMATAVTDSRVDLAWTVPDGFTDQNETYQVFRDGAPIGAPTTGLAFSDTTVSGGVTYRYRVAARLDGEESLSDELEVVTSPGVPSGLMSTGVTTSTIGLSWTAGSGSFDFFSVYRDDVRITTTSASSFTDTGLAQNTAYTYEITQTSSGTESERSTPKTISTDTAPPRLVSAAPVFGNSSQVRSSWQPPLGGGAPIRYDLFRNGTFAGSTTATSFTFGGLAPNTVFSFGVESVGSNGASTRVSVSERTYPSFAQVKTASGANGATDPPGTNGCLAAGCHATDTDATLRGLYTDPCLRDDGNRVISDCSASMPGLSIGASFQDLIIFWNAGGAPN